MGSPKLSKAEIEARVKEAGERAKAEAEERRRKEQQQEKAKEAGGRKGPDPTRYGDGKTRESPRISRVFSPALDPAGARVHVMDWKGSRLHRRNQHVHSN